MWKGIFNGSKFEDKDDIVRQHDEDGDADC